MTDICQCANSDRNGMGYRMRLNFRNLLSATMPKSESSLSRLVVPWIDNQPLIGGGLIVWCYEGDDIQARIVQ